ncbi:hypothetical protein [Longicatena caecimuris]|uniref:hypothetical protein n=1 Tax=Longicatena caecimuris TaxID=1796635 RepID=UPI0018AC6E62|nr:hypothetical protein [Longicatena caecimuris]
MIGMKKADVIKIIEDYAEQESDNQKKNDLLDCVQFLKSEYDVSDNIEKYLRSCELEDDIGIMIENFKFYVNSKFNRLERSFNELISLKNELISLKKEKSQR